MPKLKLCKYGASWCIPCRILNSFIHDFDTIIDIIEYDIDKIDPIVLSTLKIRTIPVVTINDKHRELWRHIGYISKIDLENKINEYALNK